MSQPKIGAQGDKEGVVALLFTDLVGSTELLGRLGDDAADELRRDHFTLLRRCVAEAGGRQVKTLGDGLMAAFDSPQAALRSAVAIQREVGAANVLSPDRSVAVRVGVHAGEPAQENGDLFGTPVVVAKRLCDAAQGGQILVSELVRALVGSRGGFRFRPGGRHQLKGLPEPMAVLVVEWREPSSTPPRRPPPRSTVTPRPRGPSLVGRADELGELESERRQSERGEFRCVLLVGEPGVGKTRLAGEILARHRRETINLSARAYPLGGNTPFALWAEALEGHLRTLASEDISDLCGGFLDDLAGLLRSVAAARGSAPGHETARPGLMEGLAVLLERLAAQAPVVVVLDDVHLADASSWETLAYLARNLAASRLLVLAAARPAELAEHRVATQVLLGLEQEGFLRRLPVASLDEEALTQLVAGVLGSPPPPPLVGFLAERSRGNPLFSLGLLQALLDEGADLTEPRLRALPEGLMERIGTGLRLLDEPVLATLEVLAVLGRQVDLGELARISARPVDRLGEILDGLVRARLVAEVQRGRELGYEMHHPLIQEAVYQGIGKARRRALHRLVGRALLSLDALAEAAPHVAAAAEVGDAEAIEALSDAMRQAESRRAYREALAIQGALVDLLPPGDDRWLDVLDAMTTSLEWFVEERSDIDEAQAARAMRAIDALLEGRADPGRRAAVKFRLASFLGWGTGASEEAERLWEETARLYEAAGDRPGALMTEVHLAWSRSARGDISGLDIDEVLDEMLITGDPFLMHWANYTSSWRDLHRGRLADSEAALRANINLAEQVGASQRLTVSRSHLALALAFAGRVAEATGFLEAAKAADPAYRGMVLLEWEALTRWLGGDFEGVLESAAEIARWNPGRLPLRRAPGMALAAMAAAELGRPDLAAEHLARGEAACLGYQRGMFALYCPLAEAVMAFDAGGEAVALTLFAEASDAAVATGARTWAVFALLEHTEAAGRRGEAAVAGQVAARLAEACAPLDCELYRGVAALGAAWAGLAGEAFDAALDAAEQADRLLGPCEWRAMATRTAEALGLARAATKAEGAVDALERAAAGYEACGARQRRQRALDALRELGGRGKRAVGALLGPESLTAREREVARLTAEGHTAREIGERLFIGRRTVETHLANAYAKLGVTSKVELVRKAPELGLVNP